MPLDERDAKFEKALSRHFREQCPDAETLAAYHERALAPEEMIRWKKHMAGCGTCQEILRQLETTEQIPLEANREIPIAETATRSRIREMPRRRVWRWAVPAGAIAAGLLVWVVVRDMRPPIAVQEKPVQVAEQRSAESPKNAEKERAQAQPRDGSLNDRMGTRQSASGTLSEAPPRPRRSLNSAQPMVQGRSVTKTPESQATGKFEDKIQAREEAREPAALGGEVASLEKAPALPPPPAANKAGPEFGARAAAAPVASAPAVSAEDEKKKAATVGLMARQDAAGKLSSNYKQEAHLWDSDASGLHVIRSPGAKATWRVGEKGLILRSTGKSAEWKPQASGVNSELTGGFATSESVCWMVGREGTILRTTDGGEHWQKILSPIAGDLGGIRAEDAMHAVLWDAGHRLSYETSDGGITWKPAANP